MEESKSIARSRPQKKIKKHARFDNMAAYALPMINGVLTILFCLRNC